MNRTPSLVLIDRNLRRRSAICRTFLTNGKHVEPFEDLSDLAMAWPDRGLILAHDDGETIAALDTEMGRTGIWLPIIAYAENPAPRRIAQAVLDGAVDYIVWPFDDAELIDALETTLARTERLGRVRLREAVARSRIELLTRREREVLTAVASGLSNRTIGEKLGISPRTVEIHRSKLLSKMGVNHSSEAIRLAVEASLLN